MHRKLSFSIHLGILAFAAVATIQAQERALPLRPTSTYSIVARDSDTGQLGVAVQSHWFSVGSVVSWAEAGVGAVATQSFVEVTYGPLGLQHMRAGRTAQQALRALLAGDDHTDVRQVAMVDSRGDVAVHTGENAIAEHCDHVGEGYSVQANMMLEPTVCSAMVRAFESASGDLAERMMVALEAAQAEGGDIRGRQSAALLVVNDDASLPAWGGRIFDLRIEDHPEPVVELRRLLTMARAYNHMNEGDEYFAAGEIEMAVEAYGKAATLVPENHEVLFWEAVTLATVGRVEESLPLFKRAFEMWPDWREMVRRLPASDQLPDDPELMKRILSVE